MNRNLKASLFALLALVIYSCSSIPDNHWTKAIPQNNPFVVIPAEDSNINSILQSEYIPLLDDITSSAIQLISNADTTASYSLPVKAIMLYPGTANQLQPVWVTTAPANYDKELETIFRRPFTQNQYHFKGMLIRKLHIQDRSLFAVQLNDYLLISESSLAIEDAIRTYIGDQPPAAISEADIRPSTIILNTPSLDKWVEQLGKVIYRPKIKEAFKGTKPVVLDISSEETDDFTAQSFSGSLGLSQTIPHSDLVSAFSEMNAPVELDRYISSNAAAFGIFRLKPRLAPPISVPDSSRLDSILIKDKVRYNKFAKSLDAPFSLVLYAESGFLSTGEHLFIRKLKDRSAFQQQLNLLVRDDLARINDGIYFIESQVLAKLIGSELNTFSDFYLDLSGNVVVISKRKGLAEVVASDRSRRRVIYYENEYADIRDRLPDEVSGLVITNPDFRSFISPFLSSDSYIDLLLSQSDMMTLSTQLNESDDALSFNLTTYKTQQSDQPYQEKWLFPTGGAELSGKPVMADIGGSSRDEIVFATKSGTVYALATDGTVVLQVSTGSDVPVGSPVVYDWYGTNQNVILIAAGNKVYGWNDTGTLLPKFPFELNESITSPLAVHDIDRNGLPEALVATANRQLHALDGRGDNLNQWPLTTNTVINTKPLVDYFQGSYSVLAFSDNTIHAWYPDGVPLKDFPKFVNASLSGSPTLDQGNILGNAADGYLYSIGKKNVFADSLDIFSNTSDSSGVQAVYVSNTSLSGTPTVNNVTVQTGEDTFSGNAILTMSKNGSIFFIDRNGQLQFTKNMGQPSASGFSPFVTDLDSNNSLDVISLAGFGRLYAWEIISGERIFELPTTGMSHPIVVDIDADGYKELIAQTQEGLRCWSIFGVNDDDEEENN